jgi:hypothetical protein
VREEPPGFVTVPEDDLPVEDAHAHVSELPKEAEAVPPQGEGPQGMQMPDGDAGSDIDEPRGCGKQTGRSRHSKQVRAEPHCFGFTAEAHAAAEAQAAEAHAAPEADAAAEEELSEEFTIQTLRYFGAAGEGAFADWRAPLQTEGAPADWRAPFQTEGAFADWFDAVAVLSEMPYK